MLQVLRGELHRAAGLLGLGARLAAAEEHQVLLLFRIPNHKGVTPVADVISWLRRKVKAVVFCPVNQVIAGGVHLYLAGQALG